MLNHLANIIEKDTPKLSKEIFKKRKSPFLDAETVVKKIKLYLSQISDRYDVVLHKARDGFGLTLVDELVLDTVTVLKVRSVTKETILVVEPGDVVSGVNHENVLGWKPELVVRKFQEVTPGNDLVITVWKMGGDEKTTTIDTATLSLTTPSMILSADVINFYLEKSICGGFGFVLGNCKHEHRVAEVNGDGDVRLLLRRDDRLLGVGRVRIDHLSHDQLVCLLQRFPPGRRLQFTVLRDHNCPPSTALTQSTSVHNTRTDNYHDLTSFNSLTSSSIPSSLSLPDHLHRRTSQRTYELSVMLNKSQTRGLGFRLMGGLEEGCQVFVGDIVPGGPADLNGIMGSGDIITFVNDVSTDGLRHSDVVHMLESKDCVHLQLYRPVRNVLLNDDSGIVLVSAVESFDPCGIGRISSHIPGLQVGDRILSIDGRDVYGWPHRTVQSMLRSAIEASPSHTVQLTVRNGGPRPLAGLKTIKYDLPPPQFPYESITTLMNHPHNFHSSSSPSIDNSNLSNNYETIITSSGTETNNSTSHSLATTNTNHCILGVDLTRGDSGFGFSIQGGREMNNAPLTIMRVSESASQALYEAVQPGDEILEINSVDSSCLSHAEAVALIQASGERLSMLLRRTVNTS